MNNNEIGILIILVALGLLAIYPLFNKLISYRSFYTPLKKSKKKEVSFFSPVQSIRLNTPDVKEKQIHDFIKILGEEKDSQGK